MLYLVNSFSLGMLQTAETILRVREVSVDEVKKLITNNNFTSAIGHDGTAKMLTTLLGVDVQTNRIQIKLEPSDVVIVNQLLKRLEEGIILTEKELENFPMKFYIVEVMK